MHLGFSAQALHAFEKGLAIGSYRAAKSFVRFENRSKAEGQHGEGSKTLAYDSCMINNSFLVEGFVDGVFADDNCEISARVSENRGVVHAFQVFYNVGAPGPATVLQARMLCDAVRVPRHLRLLLGKLTQHTGRMREKWPTSNVELLGKALLRLGDSPHFI